MPICLYCKESDVPFTSVEHVIPESLGNQGFGGTPPMVLPKGVVCDKCNHEKLSALDAALIGFPPISLTADALWRPFQERWVSKYQAEQREAQDVRTGENRNWTRK